MSYNDEYAEMPQNEKYVGLPNFFKICNTIEVAAKTVSVLSTAFENNLIPKDINPNVLIEKQWIEVRSLCFVLKTHVDDNLFPIKYYKNFMIRNIKLLETSSYVAAQEDFIALCDDLKKLVIENNFNRRKN